MALLQTRAVLTWQPAAARPTSEKCAACGSPASRRGSAASQRRQTALNCRVQGVASSTRGDGRVDAPIASTSSPHQSETSVQRRAVILGGLLATRVASAGAAAPGALAAEPKGFRKLDSGVLIADIFDGGTTAASRGGRVVEEGSRVAIQYTGRLAAKQGWVFDSTREPGNSASEGEPFVFTVGDPAVIRGLSEAVKGLRLGGVRRAVIPPQLGFQTESDRPVPREFWQRRRLYSTVFNQTRISNGEGDTLGTLVFDIELVQILAS